MERFKKIDYHQAIGFLIDKHYSGRKPSITYAYGYFEGDLLKAVCTFGKPASNSLCIGVCGVDYKSRVYELNRLCSLDKINIQLSEFVSWCLRDLRKENLIIVSYSDTKMNHKGYIYQACNFIYTGLTKLRTDKYSGDGKHSRHYEKGVVELKRKIRSPKHRYIYFCCNSILKKELINKLNYKIEKYPKGNNSRYILGEFIKDDIIEL